MAQRRLALVTVLLAGFAAFGPLSMDLYLPAFPHLATDLGTSAAGVQLTLTADVIGPVVGQLVAGPLSDAWGRHRLLVGTTVVCALASELCALASSAPGLTGWRFVQGATGGAGIAIGRAVAADLTSGVAAARLFSLFMSLSSVAPDRRARPGRSDPRRHRQLAADVLAARPRQRGARRRDVAVAAGDAATPAGCDRPGGRSSPWPGTGSSSGTR